MHPKDPVPPDQQKGLAYWIPCSDCEMMYVGQTECTLQVHMKEHMQAFTNPDAMTSALGEHAMNNHHRIAWEEEEVLASNQSLHQRCAIEAWHICSQPLPINREAGLLPTAYDRLINRSRPEPQLTPCFFMFVIVIDCFVYR